MRTTSWIALDGQPALFDFDFIADVEVTPVEARADAVTLVARFDQVRFVSRIAGSQAEFDKLAVGFTDPYAFTLTHGRVSQVRVAKNTHPLVVGVLRTLSAALQFSSGSPGSKSWSANEFDTTGEYSAEYRAGDTANEWHKRKERYLGVLLPKGQTLPSPEMIPEILLSEGTIRLTADGRPTKVDLRDELRLKNAQAPLCSKTLVTLRGSEARSGRSSGPDLQHLVAAGDALAVNEPYQSGLSTASIDAAKIDGKSFAEIASRLEQLESAARRPSAAKAPRADSEEAKKLAEKDARLFIALGATFRQHPETIALALKRVRNDSPAKMVFVDGLGSAGTPEAQRALIALSSADASDLRLRTTALIALSRTPRPTEQAVAALLSLADHPQLGTQARYGLGTYSRRFRDAGDRISADKLGNFLLDRLDAEQGELLVSESLRALANSGFARIVAIIPRFLADKRELVRVDAARALSSVETPEVDGLLAQTLTQDDAKAVRLAAIEAMEGRTLTPTLEQGLRVATGDSDPHVRYESVKLVARWLPQRSELRATLEHVAANDEERKIREFAKAAL